MMESRFPVFFRKLFIEKIFLGIWQKPNLSLYSFSLNLKFNEFVNLSEWISMSVQFLFENSIIFQFPKSIAKNKWPKNYS